jgi:hypothetical protein
MNTPPKSFYTINGCGTTLLDYRALTDGTYVATRWVTVFFLPIIPLSAYLICPTGQDQTTSSFLIIGRVPLNPLRIVRTYLLVVVGLAPISMVYLIWSTLIRTLGVELTFLVMLLSIAWGIYIIFVKLKNEGKAYKTQTPSEG